MNRRRSLFLLALVPLVLSLLACAPGDDGETWNVIWVTENVTTPTTWEAGNVYVIGKYDFYVTSALTIEPGTIVKFHPADGPMLTLSGSGSLTADGAADSPIIFTSFYDDVHGGDSNADGAATAPARQDWFRIYTNDLSGCLTCDHCEFYYGGGGAYTTTLSLSGSNNASDIWLGWASILYEATH